MRHGRAKAPVTDDAIRERLKELLVSELNLPGKRPVDIGDDVPLFGEGLGLDSLDALQLAVVVEEHFGVKVPEGSEARAAFASVRALAAFVASRREGVAG